MASIVVDAGPLIALFDRDDRYRRQAVEFVRDRRSRLITNLPVLTEATFVLRFSVDAQRDLLWWAHEALEIDQGTSADLPRIIALLDKSRYARRLCRCIARGIGRAVEGVTRGER